MDITTTLHSLSSSLVNMQQEDLIKVMESLEDLIKTTRETLIKKNTPNTELKSSASDASILPKNEPKQFYQYYCQPLRADLITEVHNHLKGLEYHPTGSDRPGIYLYGEYRYVYNKASAAIEPTSLASSAVMTELLNAVNCKLNTSYNSVLVNKYGNINCCLTPHKDNETVLDPASSIATLSLGATRRFQISDNDKIVIDSINVASDSILVMLPGFQDNFHHAIAAGRKSQFKKERGVRYSITFRCIQPPSATLTSPVTGHQQTEEPTSMAECPLEATPSPISTSRGSIDTIVFGSSLAKGLDEQLLSKYDRTFKVVSNSGAYITDIMEDIENLKAQENSDFTNNITSVFLLCGGNDVENLPRDSDIHYIYEDYENIVNLSKQTFPRANIKIISLIPRRAMYRAHIRNMHSVNNWLADFCTKNSIRFIDIFTFFLDKGLNFWGINKKLINRGLLHFNKVGNSVIAKVLLGAANRPWV